MPEKPAVSRRLVLGGAVAAPVAGALAAGIGGAGSAAAATPSAVAAATGAATARQPRRGPGQKSMINVPYEKHDIVRVGVIGIGQRGGPMANGWSIIPGCQVTAVCDKNADRATKLADTLESEGHPRPKTFGGSKNSYKKMLKRDDIDLVYVATPWEYHHEHGKAALLAGKHAIVELPIATELHELWDLVDTVEKTRKHLFLSENCSYGRNELAMLKMAHEGLFGEVTNGHGGYLHDLRELLFDDDYYTDSWRRLWHTRSVASFYPMHGLAPIAAAMDINRGDRMTTLQATTTPAKGLADYRARYVPKSHPSWKEEYINGDLVTCLIETDKGRIIRAEHDVSSPRPYSRINSVAGSRGIFEDYAGEGESGGRVYLEPDNTDHQWRDFDKLQKEFDHWLWKKLEEGAEEGGHGGMDYILQWRTVQQMRTGQVPDIDIYDSAVWCAPVPLSVASIEAGGKPVEVPDFTRGAWVNKRPGLDSRPSDMPD